MPQTPKQKPTIPSFRSKKETGDRVTMITVYVFPFTRLVDGSPAELILVGDSLGMVVQGLEHTNPVTLASVRSIGAQAAPMSWGEVDTSLQTGVIDGQENPVAIIWVNKSVNPILNFSSS